MAFSMQVGWDFLGLGWGQHGVDVTKIEKSMEHGEKYDSSDHYRLWNWKRVVLSFLVVAIATECELDPCRNER